MNGEDEIGALSEETKKQWRPAVRIMVIIVVIGSVLFLVFNIGAWYSCGKSDGFLTYDLKCIDIKSAGYCTDRHTGDLYEYEDVVFDGSEFA